MKTFILFISTLVTVLLIAAQPAAAATWYIKADGTGDAPTVQAGIDSAAAGDTVLLANGTYTGTGNRSMDYLGKAIVVRSESGDRALCIIDCENAGRAFSFHSGEGSGSILEGVTIENGYVDIEGGYGGGGAVECIETSPRIANCAFYGNRNVNYSGAGGAIYCELARTTFHNCAFEGNSATGAWGTGGAIQCTGGSVAVDSCSFSSNSAGLFGGAFSSIHADCTLEHCTISNNSSIYGGGLQCQMYGSLQLSDCSVSENADAGIFISDDSEASFTHCAFWDLDPAFWLQNTGQATLTDCSIYGNGVVFDMAVIGSSTANLTRCAIYGNSGNAFKIENGSATLTSCTLYGNSGDAFKINIMGNATLTSCTLYGNGGACFHLMTDYYNSLTLTKTIVSFGTSGPAVYCETGGTGNTLTLNCCDLYGNAGGDWVGCIADQYGINGNISEDPLFCGAPSANFTIPPLSPCLGGSCALIGAFGIGCTSPEPFVLSIGDVGNDQGRHARIRWMRSLYDARGDTITVTGYGIYRRQDQYLAMLDASTEKSRDGRAPARAALLDGWDYVATVPARGDSIYQYVAPTLCDSTVSGGMCWSAFFVSAMTPDPLTYFDSPVDSGYSLDNLAPSIPEGLAGVPEYGPPALALSWLPNEEADLSYYAIYRGPAEGFEPGPENRIGATMDTTFTDHYAGWSASYYKVAAIDINGNESGFALLRPDDVTGTEKPKTPRATYLAQNYPNPFNPVTKIAFGLSAAGRISLRIYDAAGRLVRVLIEGDRPAGNYEAIWDGRSAAGRAVASGIYFYRLDAGAFTETRKMVLLR
jgi:predicted outer membrane repeat protein